MFLQCVFLDNNQGYVKVILSNTSEIQKERVCQMTSPQTTTEEEVFTKTTIIILLPFL